MRTLWIVDVLYLQIYYTLKLLIYQGFYYVNYHFHGIYCGERKWCFMQFYSGNLNAKDQDGIYPFEQIFVDEEQTFGNEFPKEWRIIKTSVVTKPKLKGQYVEGQATKILAYPENVYQQMKKMNLLSTLESVDKTTLIVYDNLTNRNLKNKVLKLNDGHYFIGFSHDSKSKGLDVIWAFEHFKIYVPSGDYEIK